MYTLGLLLHERAVSLIYVSNPSKMKSDESKMLETAEHCPTAQVTVVGICCLCTDYVIKYIYEKRWLQKDDTTNHTNLQLLLSKTDSNHDNSLIIIT